MDPNTQQLAAAPETPAVVAPTGSQPTAPAATPQVDPSQWNYDPAQVQQPVEPQQPPQQEEDEYIDIPTVDPATGQPRMYTRVKRSELPQVWMEKEAYAKSLSEQNRLLMQQLSMQQQPQNFQPQAQVDPWEQRRAEIEAELKASYGEDADITGLVNVALSGEQRVHRMLEGQRIEQFNNEYAQLVAQDPDYDFRRNPTVTGIIRMFPGESPRQHYARYKSFVQTGSLEPSGSFAAPPMQPMQPPPSNVPSNIRTMFDQQAQMRRAQFTQPSGGPTAAVQPGGDPPALAQEIARQTANVDPSRAAVIAETMRERYYARKGRQ